MGDIGQKALARVSTPDKKVIEQLIADFYGCFQFEPAGQPDFAALRRIFHPQARITPPVTDTAGTLRSLSLDRFLEYCQELSKDVRPYGGKESQLSCDTEITGDTAQVLSRYEFAIGYADPVRRGTNCFQLVRESNRWWIMSLTWDRKKD